MRIDRDARRAELAEAVWQVVRERGIGAVSVRTVAEQAGVAVGSLRHLFPSQGELLVFSAELMVRRATERISRLPRSGDVGVFALDVVTNLLPLEPDSRAELEVNLALFAETPALPGLVAIRERAYRELLEGCVQLVELLTWRTRDDQTIRDARRLHALIDGLAMHLLAQPAGEDSAWAIELLSAEVDRLARGGDAVRPGLEVIGRPEQR